ncbi:MAG: hypothetical protein ACYCSN_19320 [Acidobacteriaceae bacterium]
MTPHALGVLREIAQKPLVRLSVNPGVSAPLIRDGLVEDVWMPSPFKAHKGRSCAHLQITVGRTFLKKGMEYANQD